MYLGKKDLERLLELSFLSIKEEKKERMLVDLKKILEHFSLLQEVETKQVLPNFSGHAEPLFEKIGEKKERIDPNILNQRRGDYIKGPKIF